MTNLPTSVLPKRIPHGPHMASSAIQVSPLLLEAAGSEPEEVMQKLHTSKGGLSGEEAERRLNEHGPNVVAREERHPRVHLLGKAPLHQLPGLGLVVADIA
jgi:P-type Mg2+ transporter